MGYKDAPITIVTNRKVLTLKTITGHAITFFPSTITNSVTKVPVVEMTTTTTTNSSSTMSMSMILPPPRPPMKHRPSNPKQKKREKKVALLQYYLEEKYIPK